MKIIISEKQLENVLGDPDVIQEQNEMAGNDQGTLITLQNKINDLIDKKEKELLDKSSVKILMDKGIISIQIGNNRYPMRPMVKGVYATVIPPKSKLTFTGPSMSILMPEIEKMPEYKVLSEKHPELKAQIAKLSVMGRLYTDKENQGTFKLTVTKEPMNPKDVKYAVEFGTEYPLGEFFERNKLIYRFKNGLYGTLESGQINMDLYSDNLTFDRAQAPMAKAQPVAVTINMLVLQDLFNFDSTEFKDPAQAQQQYSRYIQEMKGNIQKFGQPFIEKYKASNPTVFGYSSVDGDPNQKITGGYQPCSGSGTRQQYDMCLSQERAKIIAAELNRLLPELGGAIQFKGMGETNKWGPGWTAERPTIPEQTAGNRRYILPSVTVQVVPQSIQPQQPAANPKAQ